MVQLIALRPLAMDKVYHPGDIFSIDENTADELERRGLVERWHPPVPAADLASKIIKSEEQKVVEPEEYKSPTEAKEEEDKKAKKPVKRTRTRRGFRKTKK